MALCLLIIVALSVAIGCIPKADLHLILCDRHTPARDIFYRYYTQVAEYGPYILAILILLFGRIGDAIMAIAGFSLSSLITHIIKNIIQAPRPLTWFSTNAPDIALPLTDGVQMNFWKSFPSGHTTAFFAIAMILSLLITKKLSIKNYPLSIIVQVLLVILATLGAYSRIYLSQHFAEDVLAGMIIGTMATLLCAMVLSRWEDKKWYNYRLLIKKVPQFVCPQPIYRLFLAA